MIGTLVNVGTIIAGSIIGSCFKKAIKPQYTKALMNAMGLAATGIGINSIVQNMPKSIYPVLFIVSMALGSLIGNVIDLDRRFNSIIEKSGKTELGKGLSTAVMLFCIGSLAILGPIRSALYNDHTYLFTNATLDLVTSMVLASTYGFGIAIAAGVLFLTQGGIYLVASLVGDFISADLMCEISIVGGFLIAASGLSILEIKNLKTLNMLPALVVPPLWFGIMKIVSLL